MLADIVILTTGLAVVRISALIILLFLGLVS